VHNPKRWEQSQAPRLVNNRVGAGDHGLRGNDRRHGCEDNHGQLTPRRHQPKERCRGISWVSKSEGCLSEVVENKGGKNYPQPGAGDRWSTEMA
jgi:hypothetical protein